MLEPEVNRTINLFVKEKVHPKIEILLSFFLPSHCFLKLYDLLYSVEDNIVKIVGKQTVLLIIDFHSMDNKTQRHLSKYLLLSSTE